MAKAAVSEVEVLRYFELEPLEKATVLFNIVADKMRSRLDENGGEPTLVEPVKRRGRKTAGVELPEAIPTT